MMMENSEENKSLIDEMMEVSTLHETPTKRERKRKSFEDEDESFSWVAKKETKKKPIKKKTKKSVDAQTTQPEVKKETANVVAPAPPSDISVLDIQQAIYKALDEIIDVASLLDFSHLLGSLCKVYWDGENDWYYARILAYDSASQLHFIYYPRDNTCEWISVQQQPMLLCSELILVKTSKTSVWPAMHFTTNEVGERELREMPGYTKGQFVEFFSESLGKGEYGYYARSAMKPYTEDAPLPKGKNLKLLAAHESARAEIQEIKQLRERILAAAQQKLLFARRGNHAIGIRVQASSFVLPSEKNSISTRQYEYNMYHGAIRQYAAGIDKYLVIFDNASICPQWLSLDDTTILQDNDAFNTTSTAALSCPSASHCGLCHQRHMSSNVALGLAESADPHMLQCSQCKENYHSHCMPDGLVVNDIVLSEFRCWNCIRCLGCFKSAFSVPLTSTSLKALLNNSVYPDTPTLLCDHCINQYSTTLSFCPICYKLYEEEVPISSILEIENQKSGTKDVKITNDTSECIANTAAIEGQPPLDDQDAQMVQCSECNRWVHALCEGIDSQQYIAISNGTHPVWGDEYLCPLCRLTICKDVLTTFSNIDKEQLFAEPVSEAIAKNYYEIIKTPMDLKTMRGKAQKGTYKSLQALRQDFELMCLNAAVFNKVGDYYFNYTRDYFNKASIVFDRLPHRTTISSNGVEFNEIVNKRLGKKRKAAAEAIAEPASIAPVETSVTSTNDTCDGPQLPTSLSLSPFAYSCLPVFFSYQTADIALFASLNEVCVCCGSGGNNACLLFCADCGECYHYYCVGAPIHSMSKNARQSWRCMNCSLCCECHNEASENSLVYCECCDRAYHLHCLSPPLSSIPSSSFVCKYCVTCNHSADELTGKKFFKATQRFWGCSKTTCIKCEISLYFRGMSQLNVNTFIRLPSSCNVCSKKCIAAEDEETCWRTCRLCFSPVHDACDSRYTVDVMLNEFYYVCLKCSRSRALTDIPTHLGTSEKAWQVLQKVSLIQQKRMAVQDHRLRLQSEKYLACHLKPREKQCQWIFYEVIVMWAYNRYKILPQCGPLHQSFNIEKSVQFRIQPYLYHRACRFVRLLKKDPVSSPQSLITYINGQLRVKKSASHHSVSRLAMMAAAFLAITAEETRQLISPEVQGRVLHPPTDLVDGLVTLLRAENIDRSVAISVAERAEVIQKIKFVCDYLRSPPIGVKVDDIEPLDAPVGASEREQVQHVLQRMVTAVCTDNKVLDETTDKRKNSWFRSPLIVRPVISSQANANESDTASYTDENGAASKQGRKKEPNKYKRKKAYATLDEEGVLASMDQNTQNVNVAPSVCDSNSVTSSKTKRKKRVHVATKFQLRLVNEDRVEPPALDPELAVGLCGNKFVLRNIVTNEGDTVLMWTSHPTDSQDGVENDDTMDICDEYELHMCDTASSCDYQSQKDDIICRYRDVRCCVFCRTTEQPSECGEYMRMLQFPDGSYAHVNCVRCSSGVVESDSTLDGAVMARTKSATVYCALCGEPGAFLGCHNTSCKKTFHVTCAAAIGCVSVNVENAAQGGGGERYWATACPLHIEELSRKNWMPAAPHDTCKDLLRSLCIGDMDEDSACAHHAECATKLREGYSVRLGALTILQLGALRVESPHFHDEHVVYPVGFRSMRIFWSMTQPYTRTVYSFEIFDSFDDADFGSSDASKLRPLFRVVTADNINNIMISTSMEELFDTIVEAVRKCNRLDDNTSLLMNRALVPVSGAAATAAASRTTISINAAKNLVVYGLNAYQFFGVGTGVAIEQIPDSVVCMTANFYFDTSAGALVQYKPAFVLPKKAAVFEIFRKQAQLRNVRKRNISGCARAEGRDVTESNAFTSRITNLAKAVDGDDSDEDDESGDVSDAENTDLSRQQEKNNRFKTYIETCYKELAEGYHHNPYKYLAVRRSQIHGWGLYATTAIPSDTMIVEYLGEKIRQVVADQRELMYEREGVGSCYMFRLDRDNIIDATRKGGIARFMNHCCQPNAYARIISTTVADDTASKNLRMSTLQTAMCAELQKKEVSTTDSDTIIDKRLLQSSMIEEAKSHVDKHIVIMAARDIKAGEEITYDYKFPIEDVKLVCYCGAPGCSGSMN